MSRFNNIPLRLRLTIVMALILTLTSIALIAVSILAAREIYADGPQPNNIEIKAETRQLRGMPRPEMAVFARQKDNDFAAIGYVSAALVIVLGTGITYLMAGRTLKPVTNLSKEIEDIDENNLFRQVEVTASNDEVSKLSVSFNRMVGKLEKAFASQKNFAANAAHELKTPLAAMIANIEVLQLNARPTVDDYKETLEDSLANARRLGSLVNDLLKINAILDLKACEKIEAAPLLDQIVAELGTDIRSKNIRVLVEAADVTLYGERILLHRAISNVVQNAIKYNKPGGEIKIFASDQGDTSRITVIDTGIGIPEDQIGRIFDPFHCVDKSRSRELGGSGLGLSIAKAVVEKHGGEIEAQSVPDVYTSIAITLPKTI